MKACKKKEIWTIIVMQRKNRDKLYKTKHIHDKKDEKQ